MSNYITIDGGTTNTRINLVKNNIIVDTLQYSIGAEKAIDNKCILKEIIKAGIEKITNNNGLKTSDIKKILVSGMLTSEFGIYTLAHMTTPVGIKELHDNMVEVILNDLSEIPFVFMRGVKTKCNNLECSDIMRGEETEIIGIIDPPCSEGVYILPGSHSKIIKIDQHGRIIDFCTMLTGEMIAALSEHTILRDAVDIKHAKLNKKYLMRGFEFCKENGINEAIFKVRILKNIFSSSTDEIYSFFMGVVLCGEILKVFNLNPKRIVIGGKSQIKTAMYEILRLTLRDKVEYVPDDLASKAMTIGMIRIFESE